MRRPQRNTLLDERDEFTKMLLTFIAVGLVGLALMGWLVCQ